MTRQRQTEDKLILVTGGTGHLGRDIVARLLAQGKRTRVLARLPGTDQRVQWARGDLATGKGLREALAGVATVINAATFSPIAQRGHIRLIDFLKTPSTVDVDGTSRLLDESKRANVGHFLHVSIVGLDPRNSLPYNRVKLAGENLVRQSDLPWSIVHAAPFYYLTARLFRSMRWMPLWFLPNAVMQPVDTSDVAAYLVDCLGDDKLGVREDIGGPEAKPFPHFAQEYLAARGLHRHVVRLKMSQATAKRMGFVAAQGRKGAVSWNDWLLAHNDEPKSSVRTKPLPAKPFSA